MQHACPGTSFRPVLLLAMVISFSGCGGPSRDEILSRVNLFVNGVDADWDSYADRRLVGKEVCGDAVPSADLSTPDRLTAFKVLKVEDPREILVYPLEGHIVWPVEVELHLACVDSNKLIDAPQKFEVFQLPNDPDHWHVASVGWHPASQTRAVHNRFKWELYVGGVIGLLGFTVTWGLVTGVTRLKKWEDDALVIVPFLFAGLGGLCVGVIAGVGSLFFHLSVQNSFSSRLASAFAEGLLGAVVGVIGLGLLTVLITVSVAAVRTIPRIFTLAAKIKRPQLG